MSPPLTYGNDRPSRDGGPNESEGAGTQRTIGSKLDWLGPGLSVGAGFAFTVGASGVVRGGGVACIASVLFECRLRPFQSIVHSATTATSALTARRTPRTVAARLR